MTVDQWMYLTTFLLNLPLILLVAYLWTEVKAMQKSTHSVQYVPAPAPLPKGEQTFQEIDDETKNAFKDDHYGSIL